MGFLALRQINTCRKVPLHQMITFCIAFYESYLSTMKPLTCDFELNVCGGDQKERVLKPTDLWTRVPCTPNIKQILCTGASLFGPQMALAYRLEAISQGPKNSRFPGPNPLPLALVKDAARIKSIMHGAVYCKAQVHKQLSRVPVLNLGFSFSHSNSPHLTYLESLKKLLTIVNDSVGLKCQLINMEYFTTA